MADGTLHSYTYNCRPIESRMIYRTALFSMTLNDHYPQFQEYLKNGTRYRHSVIEILIGTYTRLTPLRSSVISNDLE